VVRGDEAIQGYGALELPDGRRILTLKTFFLMSLGITAFGFVLADFLESSNHSRLQLKLISSSMWATRRLQISCVRMSCLLADAFTLGFVYRHHLPSAMLGASLVTIGFASLMVLLNLVMMVSGNRHISATIPFVSASHTASKAVESIIKWATVYSLLINI